MRKRLIWSIAGGLIALFGVGSCVKQQVPAAVKSPVKLVSESDHWRSQGPGEKIFFSFLQKLADRGADIPSAAFAKEAQGFFPDSTFHSGLSFFGVELAYLDSIRLLYYEFSRALPPESHAYLGVFSKSGFPLDILPIKEASYNGNAAANLIDGEVIELEYYDVYDAQGMQELELNFEYYSINAQGKLQKLSTPAQVNPDRTYLEASSRLLSQVELQRYSASELEEMEMELLAAYGQQFSDRKWQELFSQNYWYTPQHEEVEHLLSDLEKVNLKNIRQLHVIY